MTDPQGTQPAQSDLGQGGTENGSGKTSAGEQTVFDPATLKANEPATPKKLSEAEQMALYEEDLMENDWGHQPC